MTIKKAEGQSLHIVVNGVNLRQPVFSHGQLYVALSQATSHRVHVLLPPDSKNGTPNVVYPGVLLD